MTTPTKKQLKSLRDFQGLMNCANAQYASDDAIALFEAHITESVRDNLNKDFRRYFGLVFSAIPKRTSIYNLTRRELRTIRRFAQSGYPMSYEAFVSVSALLKDAERLAPRSLFSRLFA